MDIPRRPRKATKRKPSRRRTPKKSAQQEAPLTLRGLARELGCSPAAVSKAVETGRLDGTYERDGRGPFRFNLEAAKRAWKENAAQDTVLGPVESGPIAGLDEGKILDKKDSAAWLQHFKALEAQRVYLVAIGRLADATKLEHAGALLGKTLRTHFQAIADQYAEDLAAEESTVECRRILREAVDRALIQAVENIEKSLAKHLGGARAAS